MKKIFSWYFVPIIVAIVGLIVCHVYFEMELIDHMAELIGKVQMSHTVASIWQTGKSMLLIAGIVMAAGISSNALAVVLSSKIAQRLRANIFYKVNHFSQEEVNKFSVAVSNFLPFASLK